MIVETTANAPLNIEKRTLREITSKLIIAPIHGLVFDAFGVSYHVESLGVDCSLEDLESLLHYVEVLGTRPVKCYIM